MSDHNKYTTLASAAALLIKTIEYYGLDYRKMALKAGFDPDKYNAPDTRLSEKKLDLIWKMAVEQTGDQCMGLTFASFVQPAALHGLGFSWMASDSLKDGLIRLVRYQNIISNSLSLTLQETASSYILTTSNPLDFNFQAVSDDALLAIVFKLCRLMLGPELTPLHVCFKHSQPDCAEKFNHFFMLPVEFDAAENLLEFDKQTCEQIVLSANPELARVNDEIVIEYLRHFDKQSLEAQARAQIIEHLPSGLPNQALIARTLNQSVRNFQRHLKNEGTSFKQLQDEIRQELAIQYLATSRRSIIEISYLLGFSDPSNFTRAFKRWMSVSPLQYRQEL